MQAKVAALAKNLQSKEICDWKRRFRGGVCAEISLAIPASARIFLISISHPFFFALDSPTRRQSAMRIATLGQAFELKT